MTCCTWLSFCWFSYVWPKQVDSECLHIFRKCTAEISMNWMPFFTVFQDTVGTLPEALPCAWYIVRSFVGVLFSGQSSKHIGCCCRKEKSNIYTAVVIAHVLFCQPFASPLFAIISTGEIKSCQFPLAKFAWSLQFHIPLMLRKVFSQHRQRQINVMVGTCQGAGP